MPIKIRPVAIIDLRTIGGNESVRNTPTMAAGIENIKRFVPNLKSIRRART